MNTPRITISALRGGSGKTLLTLGLARAFTSAGIQVKPYKKGPDYIDAAWLSLAAQRPCTNLDPFFLPQERLRALLAHTLHDGQLALIEGNRGLFDGRDVQGSCSTAELARTLQSPVLLALDCTKMTRTAAAVVAGLAAFDPTLQLGGVVLNQVASLRHGDIVRRAIETYTSIPVLGIMPRLQRNPIPERHMGLVDCASTAADAILDDLASIVNECVNVSAVLKLTESAPALPAAHEFWPPAPAAIMPRPRIGYVDDAVLWFYYAENLEALQRAGAELVKLTLLDSTPWPSLDGLYLGGGFPEELAERLASSPHLEEVRTLSENYLPIYAECGGFMLLANAIERNHCAYPMAGIFPVTACFQPKPQGLGYVEGMVTTENPFHPVGFHLRGHEFHYSQCRKDTSTAVTHALRLSSGTGMGNKQDGLLLRNTFASYTHIYAPAAPHWAEMFVAAARQYKNR